MTRHILQDQTHLDIHEGDQASVRQGDQFIVLPVDKWIEVLMKLVAHKRPGGIMVPNLSLYPKGDE